MLAVIIGREYMKKKFMAILSFITALLLSVSFASGCSLFTKNNERDYAQVVATVQIADDAPVQKILKKEMVMVYLNYGYYYAYQGYTQERIVKMIIDNLVNSVILVQNAEKEFDKGDAPFDSIYKNPDISDKWNVERYLTVDNTVDEGKVVKLSDINEAKYNTIKNINAFIESYLKKEDSAVTDTVSETVRTVPTGAKNDDEVTAQEKQDYIDKGIDKGDVNASPERRTAYLKAVKILDENELLGDEFKNDDLTTSVYYKDTLKNNEETILVTNYEKCIKDEARSKVTFRNLKDNYAEMYESQKKSYDASATEYASALSSATAENPVVYTPYSGYGYVYNLLLGADDNQAMQISELKGSETEKANRRKNILSGTKVKDLRATWILSGYDFEYDETKKTGVFTGDCSFTDKADSLPFQGEITRVKEADKDKDQKAEYRIDSIKEFGLDEFIGMMEEYVYGESKSNDSDVDSDINWYRKVTVSAGSVANYNDKINNLLFAFSTDGGSLNTFKGYSVTTKPELAGTETYVKEFADGARVLLGMGGNSYIMVATEYGYHVMFYSESLTASTSYATLEEYLDSLDADKGGFASWEEYYSDMLKKWDEDDVKDDFYLYTLQKLYSDKAVSTALSIAEKTVIQNYKGESGRVVVYTDRYADLLG